MEQNTKYLHLCNTLTQVEIIQSVKSRSRGVITTIWAIFRWLFLQHKLRTYNQSNLDSVCINENLSVSSFTNTHAMTVVGRPNMCGVPVWSRIQNTCIIEAFWHKLRAYNQSNVDPVCINENLSDFPKYPQNPKTPPTFFNNLRKVLHRVTSFENVRLQSRSRFCCCQKCCVSFGVSASENFSWVTRPFARWSNLYMRPCSSRSVA